MSQRTAFLVATALTVFVMTLMAGLAWQVMQKYNVNTLAMQQTAPTQTTSDAPIAPSANELDQTSNTDREAAFQQLIQQANQRLEEAYKQQQEQAKQIEQMQQQAKQQNESKNGQPAANPQPKYNITPEQAASIALTAEQGAVLVKPAELVSFQGTVAYEVTLDRGIVYVDANTGQVLYDSAKVIVIRDGNSGKGGGNAPSPNPSTSSPKPSSEKEREHDNDKEKKTEAEDKHEKEGDDD